MTTIKKLRNFALTAGLLAVISACSVFQGQETSGQYVDDSTITSKVKANILGDESLKGFQIHVETLQGTVQLSGFVDSAYNKAKAEEIVHNTAGVRGLQDNLIVR